MKLIFYKWDGKGYIPHSGEFQLDTMHFFRDTVRIHFREKPKDEQTETGNSSGVASAQPAKMP